MPDPLRLGVLTALWGRPAVASAVLAHTASLAVPGVEVVPLAVRSPEDPDPTPDAPGWAYVDAPNAPLSDKWNAGARALRRLGVDAVMVLGSDDLVSAGYVAEAAAHVRAGSGLVHLAGCAFVEPATRRAFHARPSRMGAGRVLSAALLDRVGWEPWPPGLDRRLDGGMDRRTGAVGRGHEPHVEPGDGRLLVDVKTAGNMWPLSAMERWRTREIAWPAARALFRHHFPLALPLIDMADDTLPDGVAELGGGWYEVGGEKVQGREAAIAAAKDNPEAKAKPKAEGVLLRAVKNVPARFTGGRRALQGREFYAAPAVARRLVRAGLAEEA